MFLKIQLNKLNLAGMKRHHTRLLATVLAILSLAILGPSCESALAQLVNEPIDDLIVVDGAVFAVAETNQVLYVGGVFTAAGPRVGGGAPVSTTTGQVEKAFPKISGSGSSAVSDGIGGWFVEKY